MSKKVGRKALPKEQLRDKTITIKCTIEEKEKINKLISKCKINNSNSEIIIKALENLVSETLENKDNKMRKIEIIEQYKKYSKGLEDNKIYCDIILREMPNEYLTDIEFVKELVKINPIILRFVEEKYMTRELIEMAVSKNPYILNLTPFSNDEELGMKAVSENGFVLESLRELQDNFSVVKAAVKKDGLALEYASDRLKSNYDIVKVAVCCKDQGGAIKYASKELRSNKELVILAYKQGRYRLKIGIPRELLKDVDVQKAIVSNRSDNFDLLPKEVQEKYGTVENFLKETKN